MRIAADLKAPEVYAVPDFDVARQEGFRLPALGTLALRSVVLERIPAGSNCEDTPP